MDRMIRTRALALILSLVGCADPPGEAADPGGAPPPGEQARDDETTELFRLMGRNTIWTAVDAVELDEWTSFHTQGLVKIGDGFFVSSVEVLEPTVRNGVETDALRDFSLDRSEGSGRGWLFKFTGDGRLLGQVELTDGAIYHPGGIDYDGRYIWVPVAEYRPNSASHVYRVDPDTLEAEKMFSVDDHIGGVVHNLHRGTLHGVSWGSRRFYTWPAPGQLGPAPTQASDWVPNGEAYIDYQDCHYRGVEFMLCGGVAGYASPAGSLAFGGLDLVDLRLAQAVHQVPVNQFIDEGAGPNPGLSLAHNAFWPEPLESGSMRLYFMTETDNQAALLIYDATPWINR